MGFSGGLDSKEFACNRGDVVLIPGLGRFPWRRRRLLPTPVFWPGEFLDWIVHGVAKSQT